MVSLLFVVQLLEMLIGWDVLTSLSYFVHSSSALRNDMENILPYFIIGFLYMFTNPSVIVATNLFRLVAVVRISHTVFHVLVPVHKFRGMSWAIGFFTTAFMGVQIVLHFL